jgi:hypothetical protein
VRGTGFYGRDVAHVHDTGHGDDARAAAPELLRRLHDAGVVLSELTDDPGDARARTRRVIVFRRSDDGAWARSDERDPLVLHDPDDVLADLRAAGFGAVVALDAWGALRLRPGHVADAARCGAA